jgi:hypothetical protein
MAMAGPDFGAFARALARFSLGLSPEARRRVACWLFVTLSLARRKPDEVPGIVLWDEVEPHALRPRR